MKTALLLIDIQNDYFPGGRMELAGAEAAALRAQILLARAHFSCGEIDADFGTNLDKTVRAFQGDRKLPVTGVVDPATWAATQTRRPLYATAPLITNISTTAARGRSDYNALQASFRQRSVRGFEYLASYTLSRTRTNNLGYYGSGGVAAEGAYLSPQYEMPTLVLSVSGKPGTDNRPGLVVQRARTRSSGIAARAARPRG